MAQVQTIQGQVDVNCHADKLFNLWARKTHQIANMCPDKISEVEITEGDYYSATSIKTWHYVLDGQVTMCKSKEEIDEASKSVSYNVVGGALKDSHKSYNSKMQVIPTGENTCSVKWTMNFEKMTDDAAAPSNILDFNLNLAKETGERLCRAA